jgi:predicted metal-dependent phosphoesterase TrpH
MKADLHTHTTASDGTVSPAGIITLALDCDVDVLAICDHDSVEGLAEAFAATTDTPLTLVPGVELSAVHDGRDVHVLGYFVDPADGVLLGHLEDLRAARARRAEAIVEALTASGYDLTLDDVLAFSDGGAVGRSHVARALVHRGHAGSVADAFQRLLGHGMPFYVPKDVRSPEEVISVIREAGGLAVLAHPAVSGIEDAIEHLRSAGLSGIEAYHADHTVEQRLRLASLAEELGLLVTGGTDYHGPHAPNPEIGSVAWPQAHLERFLTAGGVDHRP